MADANQDRRGSLLVFADDWGRHPSSCQHLMGKLLHRYNIWWVNTIGTRRPKLDRLTLRRGIEKFGPWIGKSSKSDSSSIPEGLTVLHPKMWPWFSHRHDRWLNEKLLLRSLGTTLRSLPTPVVAISTLPVVADLVGPLPVAGWIYYCVDDFGAWPGLDGHTLKQMEAELVKKVDHIVAAGENLQEHVFTMGRDAELVSHGVELEHWRGNGLTVPLDELSDHERPLVVFWGLIDQRMDIAFLEQLSCDMNEGTIVLVGPQEDPDPRLAKIPRVSMVPSLPYQDLPRIAIEASVLIMPYRDLPVTRAMQPLKLKEYLATGKPTVVRELPAVTDWSDCLDVATSADEFSRLVRQRITDGQADNQRQALGRIDQEGWEAKAEQFDRLAIDPLMSVASNEL